MDPFALREAVKAALYAAGHPRHTAQQAGWCIALAGADAATRVEIWYQAAGLAGDFSDAGIYLPAWQATLVAAGFTVQADTFAATGVSMLWVWMPTEAAP